MNEEEKAVEHGSNGGQSAQELIRHRKTLADLVAVELRERIASGQLPMGAEINQMEVTTELQVSRAAVREAFRKLEAAGMIQLTPHRHAVVTILHENQIEDLVAIRMLIEQIAVRRIVCADVTPDQIARLRRLLKAMEIEREHGAWLALDRQFHLALCELSRNPILPKILDAVRLPVERFMRAHGTIAPRREANNAEHEAVVEALAKGDISTVARVLRQHILATKQRLKSSVRDSKRQEAGE